MVPTHLQHQDSRFQFQVKMMKQSHSFHELRSSLPLMLVVLVTIQPLKGMQSVISHDEQKGCFFLVHKYKLQVKNIHFPGINFSGYNFCRNNQSIGCFYLIILSLLITHILEGIRVVIIEHTLILTRLE